MVKKGASGGCSADKAQQRHRGIQPLCSLQGVFCALLPGAALNAPCPGYRFIADCSVVARTDALHRLRGIQPISSLQGVFCALLPGAELNAPCPGYRFIADCSAVARTDAQHRLREFSCSVLYKGYSARCSRGRRSTLFARATGSSPSAVW